MTIEQALVESGNEAWRSDVIAATERWVTRAVIGLNLCPFAKPVHVSGRIRFAVTETDNREGLIEALITELELLAGADPAAVETTLLIHPHVLNDFLDFNDFLEVADAAIDELELTGTLQVASFHPHYQFEGTAADDIENFTNRSPYPTLHLLREQSVERAVAAYPDTAKIYQANIATLRRLGIDGWEKLMTDPG